jgi:adenosylcobinamide-GDP ribazoletransferase
VNKIPEPSQAGRPASPLAAFLAAMQFLTILPPVIRRPFTPQELGMAVGFYPLVGVLLGGFLAGSNALFRLIFPPTVCAVLVLVLWIISTGALHIDGFLDAFDGLFGGGSPENRLAIMRDERLGAFAFSGGILLVLVKFTALSSIHQPLSALLLAPTFSRWGMATVLAAHPYARPDGIGRDIKDNTSWRQVIFATIIAALVAVLVGSWRGLVVMAVVALVVWGGARFTLHRIPGLTGDIYGALNEIAEAVVLLIFSLRVLG